MGEGTTGSCLCGLVTFEVTGPFHKFHWCDRAPWYDAGVGAERFDGYPE